jgi:UDP-glucuronate decarboxylase
MPNPSLEHKPSYVEATDLAQIKNSAIHEFNKLSGKPVLITGGGGFLGYYLSKSLLLWNESSPQNKRIHLYLLDNFSRGVPDWISQISNRSDTTILRRDVTQPLSADLFPDPPSHIIHAASLASPTFYRRHPLETMDANVNGLRMALDYSVGRSDAGDPVEGILYLSSSEIYGNPPPDDIPTPETYPGNVSCTGPRACYDESKRYGETLCVNFSRQHGLPVKIVRPFNNFGPGLRLDDGRVISDFARNIMSNEDITLFSDGLPTRTFCYISDAVTGYYKALIVGKPGEVYNIGSEKPEISMYDLAKMMAEIGRTEFNYPGKVIKKTSQDPEFLTDSPTRRRPDISKAREELGYRPLIDLKTGLTRTLRWYRESEGL